MLLACAAEAASGAFQGVSTSDLTSRHLGELCSGLLIVNRSLSRGNCPHFLTAHPVFSQSNTLSTGNPGTGTVGPSDSSHQQSRYQTLNYILITKSHTFEY
jgi:hypothetical protein